ncbi:MAG TPA: adenylate/guanylate cyclase domain-containing protein [Bradyrhizobium sp.]|nr:adenylate/guanylate cyclase domain-containing protein [Bradyrhizobium sp.]
MTAISDIWHGPGGTRARVSADFEHALMREVLASELLRVKALIVTTVILAVVVMATYYLEQTAVERLWQGRMRPIYTFEILVPFGLFELWVMTAIQRHIKMDRDLPIIRRYIGVLIETSMPTFALMLHIQNMGTIKAVGFVIPVSYGIFIVLSTLRLDFWLSCFTGLVAATELFLVSVFYHPAGAAAATAADAVPDIYYHGARSVVVLICGVLAGAVGVQLRRGFAASIRAATARDHVTNLFGQHVSPQVVERLMAEGATTRSDIRRVAVMFVDFRSFTASARSRSPQEVVERLDGAFAVLVETLDRHGGIVNKFLGDGFLALFGAPLDAADAAHRAVAAAREMLNAMDRINDVSDWKLRIGIGVHFGEVVAGNIGSPRRKEYTVIGDTVNFASRLEALNKKFGSQLLISAAVREALGEDGDDAVSLGEVPIRGYEQPMAVFQLG